jgi:hypothetical protein
MSDSFRYRRPSVTSMCIVFISAGLAAMRTVAGDVPCMDHADCKAGTNTLSRNAGFDQSADETSTPKSTRLRFPSPVLLRPVLWFQVFSIYKFQKWQKKSP